MTYPLRTRCLVQEAAGPEGDPSAAVTGRMEELPAQACSRPAAGVAAAASIELESGRKCKMQAKGHAGPNIARMGIGSWSVDRDAGLATSHV